MSYLTLNQQSYKTFVFFFGESETTYSELLSECQGTEEDTSDGLLANPRTLILTKASSPLTIDR